MDVDEADDHIMVIDADLGELSAQCSQCHHPTESTGIFISHDKSDRDQADSAEDPQMRMLSAQIGE